MKLDIIYEDEDLIVIDKPSGFTVNKSDTTANQETIQDWAEEKIGVPGVPSVSRVSSGDKKARVTFDTSDTFDTFYQRAGIVHRLDKETSGILLIAKNLHSFLELQRQFKERLVKKTYRALAHGRVIPETGEINVPVGRLPWNRKQFGIVSSGRESKTLYKVIRFYKNSKSKEDLSLVELYPYSGRTHQIRVHLKYIGHPVFSDFLYAGRKTARNDRKLLSRVFLHAAKITFTHPRTGESVSFESKLPQELSQILSTFSAI